MPERTVKMLFYNWMDEEGVGHSASRGEVVDLPDDEAERGDSLGAFEESDEEVTGVSDAVLAAYGVSGADSESGVETQPPPPVHDDAKEPPDPEEGLEGEPGEQPDPTSEGYPDLAEGADEDTPGSPGTQTPNEPVNVSEPAPSKPRRRGGAAQPEEQQSP